MNRTVFFETDESEERYFRDHLGDLDTFFVREPLHHDTLERAADAEIVSVFVDSTVDSTVIDALPNLRMIATRSTGYDQIDLKACAARDITVSNVPLYGENTVAEHTFALILALTRRIHEAWVRTQRDNFSLEGLQGTDLKGKTLGVVGAGNIGKHVIRIARGFGMEVVAFDLHPDRILAEVLGFRYVDMDELLAVSDIVTLHAPATAATYHLIDREAFAQMKTGAVLVNTSRGSLVDTRALIAALDSGQLASAGLDVFEGEELIGEEQELLSKPEAGEQIRLLLQRQVLRNREDIVITPHMAFYSQEAVTRIMDETIANIRAWIAGSPANVVSTPPSKS